MSTTLSAPAGSRRWAPSAAAVRVPLAVADRPGAGLLGRLDAALDQVGDAARGVLLLLVLVLNELRIRNARLLDCDGGLHVGTAPG
jgi:hypothetical protein